MNKTASSTKKIWSSAFTLDARSLATLRIGCALLVLFDLIRRLPDLRLHYSDVGLYPRLLFFSEYRLPGLWSLHAAVGSPTAEGLLFGLTALASLSLLIGYRTWLSSVATWLLVASMQSRNEMLNNGGDEYLRLLLFWGLFLPWGRFASVDTWRLGPQQPAVRSAGTIALTAQIIIVYWFTSYLKTGAEWRSEHTAIYYALSYEQYATRLGQWLLRFPTLLPFMTRGVIFFEDFGLYALLLPPRYFKLRILTIGGFLALHIGIGLTMNLTIFAPVCCLAVLALLPAEFWDAIVRRAFPQRTAFLPPLATAPDRSLAWTQMAASAAVGLLLPLVIAWNIAGIPTPPLELPLSARWLGVALRLDQAWGMFAPGPARDDGWFVARGERLNGERVNLLTGEVGDPGFKHPDLPSETFRTGHWRTYLNHLRHNARPNDFFALSLGYCWLWQEAPPSPGEPLANIDVYYVEKTLAPAGSVLHAVPRLLWHQKCAATPGLIAHKDAVGTRAY